MTNSEKRPLEPWRVLGTLERHRVSYILVGSLAAVVHGAGGIADDVEIAPALKADNLRRLASALAELADTPVSLDVDAIINGASTTITTGAGDVAITPEPVGSRGYDDLRRAAGREPIGQGIRPNIASIADLIRIADASHEPVLEARAQALRRVAELGLELGIEL